jgi:hypothetical protein
MFRLPKGYDWTDLPTKSYELWNMLYFVALILLLRVFVEAIVGLSIGKCLGYVDESLSLAILNHIFGGFAEQTKRKKVLGNY